MAWNVEFDDAAIKEFSKIDHAWQQRITSYLREVISLPDPRLRGSALTGNLVGLWRYRVGDYRIVCQLKHDVLVVRVVTVGHRRNVYE